MACALPIGAHAVTIKDVEAKARALASESFRPPATKLPSELGALDYDALRDIRFRPDKATWRADKLPFELMYFHPGKNFPDPVRINLSDTRGTKRVDFDADLFDYGRNKVDPKKLRGVGLAGFRVHYSVNKSSYKDEVLVFLGASYFRAVGKGQTYGLSARGLAIDTGMDRAEEFPSFIGYWLEQPAPRSNSLIVYGLLDSPSVAGAYRFAITPGDTQLMEIDAALYPRKSIERLGIGPCTSMFQTGENDRRMGYDWRPEIHDTDGLQMHTGAGEWIWRPLTNPPQLRFNAYADQNPRGFGLLQRDRNFDHYQDDGVFYERRPSLWVEPKSGWGAGSVQLVEIPTVDETFDNIVAFWNPNEKPQPGQELLFAYRLYWGRPPAQPPLAHCVATYTGLGGVVGQKRSYFSWRFSVDFAGGDFGLLGPNAKVEPVITASRGQVEITSARPLFSIKGWRAMFDLKLDDSLEPITIRLHLMADGQPLTETWLYQYSPPPLAERKLY